MRQVGFLLLPGGLGESSFPEVPRGNSKREPCSRLGGALPFTTWAACEERDWERLQGSAAS